MHLLVDSQADVLARRAACFAAAPTVWQIDGTALIAAEPRRSGGALPALPAPDLAELLVDAGPRGRRRGRHGPRRDQRPRGGSHRPRHDHRRDPARRAAPRGRRGPRRPRADGHAPRRPRPVDQLARVVDSCGPSDARRRAPPAQPAGARALAARPPHRAPGADRPGPTPVDRAGRAAPQPPRPGRGDGARRRRRMATPSSWRARSASTSTSCPLPPTPGSRRPPTPASCSSCRSATPTPSPRRRWPPQRLCWRPAPRLVAAAEGELAHWTAAMRSASRSLTPCWTALPTSNGSTWRSKRAWPTLG